LTVGFFFYLFFFFCGAVISIITMRFAAFVAFALAACAVSAENTRPIIGILDQNYGDKDTYIAASYVKWVESAGARAVPLFYSKWSTSTMEDMLKNLNGVVLPGGGQSFSGKYLAQLNTIFHFAKKANDNGVHFPLWGTCLGVCFILLFLLRPLFCASSIHV